MLSRIDGLVVPLNGSLQHARASRLVKWDKKTCFGVFELDNTPGMRGLTITVPNYYIETFGNWIQRGSMPGKRDFFVETYYTHCAACAIENETKCQGHISKEYQLGYGEARRKLANMMRKNHDIAKLQLTLFDFPFFGLKRHELGIDYRPQWGMEE